MSNRYTLSAATRDQAGKGVARALRREKRLPAVIYGDNKDPVTISLPQKEVGMEYNKGHMFTTLCDIEVDGEKHLVLARDVQLHPVRDTVQHVDFLRVNAKTKLKVNVPVNFVNYEDSLAAQEKGVQNIVRHEVEVHCLATNIPDAIDVDLSSFNIGDAVKISDAQMPEGAKPVIDDRDFTLMTIMAPKSLAALEAEEAADAEAPETPDAPESETGNAEGDAPAAEGDDAAKAE